METTFISIHDLTDNATILYSSDSVIDLLGYTPDEIVNRSAWDFFSLEDLPPARDFHQRGVSSDKAAMLAYCRIRDSKGRWIGCEVCFTIVYDVMVVCTSIYKRNLTSEKRALEAPLVRRIFASSPKDPRYHMLSHLSAKFRQTTKPNDHEPRAALFLNRFTRTLTIMYATSGLQDVIGIPADTMRGRSFYFCISEACLTDAINCLEGAKENDSLAYLRFWFRDPRLSDEAPSPGSENSDEEMTTDASEDGIARSQSAQTSPETDMDLDSDGSKAQSRHSSGDSTSHADTHEAIFGQALRAESSATSMAVSPDREMRSPSQPESGQIELEAVISCTSDGLVVCLRKARPMIPHPAHRPSRPVYERGLFAAPWAKTPILPPLEARRGAGFGSAFAPALGPQGARPATVSPTRANTSDQSGFMNAIRDQAIFAWALTGINGSMAFYGNGTPRSGSIPADGLPVWANDQGQAESCASGHESDRGSNGYNSGNDMYGRVLPDGKHSANMFGDPGLDRKGLSTSRPQGDHGSRGNAS